MSRGKQPLRQLISAICHWARNGHILEISIGAEPRREQNDYADALALINRAITDYLNPDRGNFDNDTLFCDDWFSQYGWGQGQFGEADTLLAPKAHR